MSLRKTRYLSFTLWDIENKVTLRDDLKPYTKTSRDTAKEKGLKRPLGASSQLGQLFTRRPGPWNSPNSRPQPQSGNALTYFTTFSPLTGRPVGVAAPGTCSDGDCLFRGTEQPVIEGHYLLAGIRFTGQKICNLKLLDDAYKLLLNSLHVACHFFYFN